MTGMVLAWLTGLGVMSWRTAQEYHRPPVPGRILAASVVFAALALLAEYEPARRAAVLAAWGFDLAIVLKLPPSALTTAPFSSPGQESARAHQGVQGAGGSA